MEPKETALLCGRAAGALQAWRRAAQRARPQSQVTGIRGFTLGRVDGDSNPAGANRSHGDPPPAMTLDPLPATRQPAERSGAPPERLQVPDRHQGREGVAGVSTGHGSVSLGACESAVREGAPSRSSVLSDQAVEPPAGLPRAGGPLSALLPRAPGSSGQQPLQKLKEGMQSENTYGVSSPVSQS